MSAKVTVRDLHKKYGEFEAARGVSFEIQDGEIFGMLGPNGAGKTTSLECVIGLREPDSGEVTICGINAREKPREVRQRIGATLQSTSLQDKITPREALNLFSSFYERSEAPADLIKRFGLEEKADLPFDSLSGGQKQRLALALAFINKPDLVFLDEPTTGLDPQSRRDLHVEIAQMKRDGHTVLLTTHYIEEAELLCDRIGIMHQGRIIATGTPRDLIAQSSTTQAVSIETLQPLDPEWLSRLPAIQDLVAKERTAAFRTADTTRTISELMKVLESRRIELVDLHVRKATLEDVFINLTGTNLTQT